jgi:hypothetical protein
MAATTTSILVKANNKIKLYNALSYLCCCCCCFAMVKCMDEVFDLLDAVVKKFGKSRLNAMRKWVLEEKFKFDLACVKVGTKQGGIRYDVNMISMIQSGNLELFRSLLLDRVFIYSSFGVNHKMTEYRKSVYDTYLELGGSVDVLKRCLPEVLAEYYDPTSTSMSKFYNLLLNDPILRDNWCEKTRDSPISPIAPPNAPPDSPDSPIACQKDLPAVAS